MRAERWCCFGIGGVGLGTQGVSGSPWRPRRFANRRVPPMYANGKPWMEKSRNRRAVLSCQISGSLSSFRSSLRPLGGRRTRPRTDAPLFGIGAFGVLSELETALSPLAHSQQMGAIREYCYQSISSLSCAFFKARTNREWDSCQTSFAESYCLTRSASSSMGPMSCRLRPKCAGGSLS